MGLKEAKYMVLFIVIVLAVTNIYSVGLVREGNDNLLSCAVSDTDLKEGGYVIGLYSNETGELTDADSLTKWVNNSGTDNVITDSDLFDFAFKSWGWLRDGISLLFEFIYAPFVLTNAWVSCSELAVKNIFWWLPWLIGLTWTITYIITFLQIIWKE